MDGEYINVCRNCGEVFETDSEYTDLCSKCKIAASEVRKKCCKCSITYLSSDPFSLYCPECKDLRDTSCKICGAPINVKGGRKYCAECARHMANEGKKNNRELFDARKAVSKSAEKRRLKRAERGGPTISEAVTEAQKLGISYGQYMERYSDK